MLNTLYQSVIKGDAAGVTEGVQQALEAGHHPAAILDQAMIAAMAEVGRRFEAQEYFVPEMLIAARAMKAGMAILKPYLLEAAIEPVSKVVLGTVKGDLHDIGKNLVGMSALLTTTMPGMRMTIEALSEAGLRDHLTVMVGGAPVTQQFADEIGADLYAPDASAAANRARALLEAA